MREFFKALRNTSLRDFAYVQVWYWAWSIQAVCMTGWLGHHR